MRTGVSYMGHHNPEHIESDISEMKNLQLDDVLLAAQENDFVHFPGKLKFTSDIAAAHELRPVCIFWGALNLFGGGRSSQFLLEHPEGRQVGADGILKPAGCYMNPACQARIMEMIDTIADLGFRGYFIDEPNPLRDCFCSSCQRTFWAWYGGDLFKANKNERELFRHKCVVEYVKQIAGYCKANHPQLETMTCLMPIDKEIWHEASRIDDLDNLGTDIYWVNENKYVEEMTPLVNQLDNLCKTSLKIHHEWLQCWKVKRGNEQRILEQGKILVRERPDSLYVWAWKGQIGTTESCDDPATCWDYACEVFRLAKA